MAATMASHLPRRAVSGGAAAAAAAWPGTGPGSLPGGGARRALTIAREFFNRDTENRVLRTILDNEPQFTVVLGGPSTGKTRLLAHILRDPASPYATLHLDLRGIALHKYQQLGDRLTSKLPAWVAPTSPLQKLLAAVKRTMGSASTTPVSSLELKLPDGNQPSERSLKDFTRTLNVLKSVVPEWRLRHGTERKPVLFIDQANLLSEISTRPDDDGAVALRSLLDWCVLNTKQEGRFHVVLASSSSAFMDWLGAQGITPPDVSPLVIGDLDRDQAMAYFKRRLQMADVPSNVAVPSFDEVYRVCGGHMLSIREYIREAHLAAAMSRRQEFVFDGLQNAHARLASMLSQARSSSKAWNEQHVLRIFSAIHRNGWIVREDAENQFSRSLVKALIDADVVHYRPNRAIVADLPGQPARAVLTALLPVDRVVMGDIVSKATA